MIPRAPQAHLPPPPSHTYTHPHVPTESVTHVSTCSLVFRLPCLGYHDVAILESGRGGGGTRKAETVVIGIIM